MAAQNIVKDIEATVNDDMELVIFWEMDGPAMSRVEYQPGNVSGTTETFVSLDGRHSHVIPNALPGLHLTRIILKTGQAQPPF